VSRPLAAAPRARATLVAAVDERARVSSLRARIGARAGLVSRWGLLLTALALFSALLATGLSAYLAVQGSAVPLVRLLARELVVSVRHALHVGDVVTPETVRDALGDLESEGARYIAVIGQDGAVIASAGAPAVTSWSPAGGGPGPQLELGARGRARVTGPFVGAGGGAGWRARTGAPPDAPLPWEALADARIVIEFEPLVVQHLSAHVLATLVIGACTALVLLGATVVFWRLSLRAERAATQLERDRQLKRLGQMSAVLGHELRNPLAGLKGHAQLILRKLPEGDAARSAAETVVREAVRLEQLANQVLEFARTGDVRPRAEDPLLVARGAAEALDCERVRLEVGPGGLPPWPLDRPRMEQVLTNLLRNAVQASPGGDPVELAAYLEGEDALVFEVRDRGEGVTPGDEDAIFQPFVTHRTKGSGLGLTLARQIVEGHGGRIEAGNRPGGGAIFRVSIPRGQG
jgi:two-component system sensor histidine kinase HydH